MKKQLIAVIVGAILLFIWQFLSWAMLNIHGAETRYTPNQERIIEALSQNLPEEGSFMIPNVPPGTPMNQQEPMMKAWEGKPWATITYHKAMNTDMTMNMVRGFAIDLVALFLLVWLLGKIQQPNFATVIQACLAIGVISYLTIPYLHSVWYKTETLGHLIDAFGCWGLIGVWLGWFLNRK